MHFFLSQLCFSCFISGIGWKESFLKQETWKKKEEIDMGSMQIEDEQAKEVNQLAKQWPIARGM